MTSEKLKSRVHRRIGYTFDERTLQILREEAEKRGVSRSALLRMLLLTLREGRVQFL